MVLVRRLEHGLAELRARLADRAGRARRRSGSEMDDVFVETGLDRPHADTVTPISDSRRRLHHNQPGQA